jgi:hypothetical protein
VPLLNQYLPSVISASDGTHTLNQAIDVQVDTWQHAFVIVRLASGFAIESWCTLSGTQEALR